MEMLFIVSWVWLEESSSSVSGFGMIDMIMNFAWVCERIF